MRDLADLYDIIDVDLQLSAVKLERMLMCEMEDLVDTESISQYDMSALLEICEPLHVTEENGTLGLPRARVPPSVRACCADRHATSRRAWIITTVQFNRVHVA